MHPYPHHRRVQQCPGQELAVFRNKAAARPLVRLTFPSPGRTSPLLAFAGVSHSCCSDSSGCIIITSFGGSGSNCLSKRIIVMQLPANMRIFSSLQGQELSPFPRHQPVQQSFYTLLGLSPMVRGTFLFISTGFRVRAGGPGSCDANHSLLLTLFCLF